MKSWGLAWSLLLTIVLVALTSIACQPNQDTAATPTSTTKAATPTASGSALFNTALNKFKAANSYRFNIKAVHEWTSEGQKQLSEFTGQGSHTKPDRYQWQIEGYADTYFAVEITGNKIKAADTRGEVTNASITFGGPGFGTSPYVVITYLLNAQNVKTIDTATLNGVKTNHYSFEPNKDALAAKDAALASEMQRVKSVQGEVWVAEADGRVLREQVKVNFTSRTGMSETVVETLDFFDYDK